MKKLIIITGIILGAYLLLMTTAVPRGETPAAVSAAAEEKASAGYTIGSHEGKVAVYRQGKLVLLTETRLSSLPKSDRARLEKGVQIDSIKELKMLLQDYCT